MAHTCIVLETIAKFLTSSQVGCQDAQCIAALSLVLKGLDAVIAQVGQGTVSCRGPPSRTNMESNFLLCDEMEGKGTTPAKQHTIFNLIKYDILTA